MGYKKHHHANSTTLLHAFFITIIISSTHSGMGGVCRAKGGGRLRPSAPSFCTTKHLQHDRKRREDGAGRRADDHLNLHLAESPTVACVGFVRFCPCFREDGGGTRQVTATQERELYRKQTLTHGKISVNKLAGAMTASSHPPQSPTRDCRDDCDAAWTTVNRSNEQRTMNKAANGDVGLGSLNVRGSRETCKRR